MPFLAGPRRLRDSRFNGVTSATKFSLPQYKTASRLQVATGEPQLAGKCWADSLPNLKPTPSDMHANCIRTGIMMALT